MANAPDRAVLPPEPPAPPRERHPGALPGPDEPRGEDAEWFQRVAPDVQDEYRAVWAAKDARHVARTELRQRSFVQGAIRGAAVFFVTDLMFGSGGLGAHVGAAVLGALVGTLWVKFRAGLFAHVVSGLVPWALYAVCFVHDVLGTFLLFFGMVLHAGLCGMMFHARDAHVGLGEET